MSSNPSFNPGVSNEEVMFQCIEQGGPMNIIKYLYEIGTTCREGAMDIAAKNGHLDVVKWLHENGKTCTTDAMNWACENGDLKMVKYLHEIDAPSSPLAMEIAAEKGHLHIVKYLHANVSTGACLTEVTDLAIKAGKLNVVKYLYKFYHGCPSCAIKLAINNRRKHIAVWIRRKESKRKNVQKC